MLFPNSITLASENEQSAEVLIKEINEIIFKKRLFTPKVIDYTIKIIKNWPDSNYVCEVIKIYDYRININIRGGSGQLGDVEVKKNTSKWFEKYLLNNNTNTLETSEVLVHAMLLLKPHDFTDFFYVPYAIELLEGKKPYQRYEPKFIKNKSIKILTYLENYSNDDNDKILAFYFLLEHYFATENGLLHFRDFVNKHSNNRIIAMARIKYVNHLLKQNKYNDAITELNNLINLYKYFEVPYENYKYDALCYIKLAKIYLNIKDYKNAKKYINLLKQIVPPDFEELIELNKELK
jgi:hypothetical protein